MASKPIITDAALIPLLWIRGEPEPVIRRAIGEVAAAGNTGFILESRPHPAWGESRWWAKLRVVIDVTNTAQARWSDKYSKAAPRAGLFGPVRVRYEEKKS